MTKTTTRQRAVNLYTISADGEPVAQAEAISQAEAVRLYVESQQQPVLSARLASPMDARKLAHLPLLSRGAAAAPERDQRVPNLLDEPVNVVRFTATVSEPSEVLAPDHVEDVRDMVTGVAAEPPGESAEPAALDASAPAGVELEDSASGAGDALASPMSCASDGRAEVLEDAAAAEELPAATDSAPEWLDETALTARKSDAFRAGFERGKQGLKRFSVEMLHLDVEMMRNVRSRADANAVHDELLRGFEAGRDAVEPKTELKHQAEQAAVRGAGKIVAKYRNPATGESWSGRGLRPRWLVNAIGEGRTLEDFAV